jgi:ring-1,2-phenylacetyl-CoA epoxidase subunit PaaA
MTPLVGDAQLRQYLAAGGLVERLDEMSEEYRRELRKMLLLAADTELRSVPMLYGYFDLGVPYRYVQPMLSVIQDELGHAHIDYRLLEALGEDVDALLFERPIEAWASPYFFDMPMETWAEVAVAEGLGEYGGGVLVRNIYHHTSYAPWRRALAKVDLEENFHVKFGQTLMRELARDDEQRPALQAAVDWLFPLLLEFVGPPGREVDPQIDLRLKGQRVDDLRQDYLRFMASFCEELGLRVPAHFEPDLDRYVLDIPFPCAFDAERKRWDFGSAVTWPDVLKRWKARGPLADEHLRLLRSGQHSLNAWAARSSA